MAKKFQLNVPDPCQEDWKEMKTTGCGRFCDSCQKTVVDFTMMDDQQLALFFKKNTENVCGRLRVDQLSKDLFVPAKKIPWFRYVLKAIIPAVLFSNKGYTQGEVRKTIPETTQAPVDQAKNRVIVGDTIKIIQRTIKGRVSDGEGNAVVGATVMLRGTSIGTVTKEDGSFQLRVGEKDRLAQLDVSCVGYEARLFSCPVNDVEVNAMITLELQEAVTMGMVAVQVAPPKKTVPPEYIVTDTTVLKVFPNPVLSGTSINIKLDDTFNEEYYEFRLVSLNGRTIFKNKIWIDKDARVLNIGLPAVAAGRYFAVLHNKKLKKEYAQQVLVVR
ncbi:carboxypeptidase-like regulatory domain-containing protein [Terrimonas sp. NA20]|uniref:Carboxypeptidase-like regulatory domain-containing protein n=1 Tax=Terrimonas ginsenosidimutans TaxID=2908004 RepID=A0ABS9KY80_9BACT|nr:carboxypeptidase-like regulatory domain-containing protein [Terrimonas ginsenosidimutans]MCG2617307.1 carboxypeptidase-like regulatory domain-containing protein [Terrimonas ginsenosidimutans]